MDTRVHRALRHLEQAGDDRVGHEGAKIPQISQGAFILLSRSFEGPKESFPLQLSHFFGKPSLIDANGAPGAVSARRHPLETTALDFQKAASLGEGQGQMGLGKARDLRGEAGLAISGLPGALDEKVEDAAVACLPVPPRRENRGTIDRRLDGQGIAFAFPLVMFGVGETKGALAGHVALAKTAFVPSVAFGQIAQARGDIAFETRTSINIAVEQGKDALSMMREAIGRLIDRVEAESPRIAVENLAQGREKGPAPLLALLPLPPSRFKAELLHAFLLGETKQEACQAPNRQAR